MKNFYKKADLLIFMLLEYPIVEKAFFLFIVKYIEKSTMLIALQQLCSQKYIFCNQELLNKSVFP